MQLFLILSLIIFIVMISANYDILERFFNFIEDNTVWSKLGRKINEIHGFPGTNNIIKKAYMVRSLKSKNSQRAFYRLLNLYVQTPKNLRSNIERFIEELSIDDINKYTTKYFVETINIFIADTKREIKKYGKEIKNKYKNKWG